MVASVSARKLFGDWLVYSDFQIKKRSDSWRENDASLETPELYNNKALGIPAHLVGA